MDTIKGTVTVSNDYKHLEWQDRFPWPLERNLRVKALNANDCLYITSVTLTINKETNEPELIVGLGPAAWAR